MKAHLRRNSPNNNVNSICLQFFAKQTNTDKQILLLQIVIRSYFY